MTRRVFLGTSLAAFAQEAAIDFVCPMDPDVRSKVPAKCPRCGMKLVAGIPDGREFAVELTTQRRVLKPDSPVRLRILLKDPLTKRAAKLQLIHEKLLHLFLVSGDLQSFAHEHPVAQPDGSFTFETRFSQAGEWRLLFDFYPENAAPQMIAKTLWVAGKHTPVPLAADTSPKKAENLEVSLRTDPPVAKAGLKTMLFFTLNPGDHIEPWLGAWGHMLVASSDLIDMIHVHPAWEDKGDAIQFNVIFPRPGLHKLWVQFQRSGIVNTAAFTIPVEAV